jgi:hypothetical protein
VTKIIRLLTDGPYSHVELQFTDGCRFFSSGHGIYTGSHVVCDHKIYDHWWDRILIPATQKQENVAEGFAFHLIGFPFDWRGLISFLLPFIDRRRKAKYCSAIVLEVLQGSLHMFPDVQLKVSPNGLYRLFLSSHPIMISPPVADVAYISPETPTTSFVPVVAHPSSFPPKCR